LSTRRHLDRPISGSALADSALASSTRKSLVAVCIITAVAFIACLPTLHIYFLTDDFALIHAFHNLSPAQFLQLLHMDTRLFVSGDARQEFRPLTSLFYLAAYHLWGVRVLGYHLCEMGFHALVSILVFLIAGSLAPGNLRRAGFAGVLFAVRPPHAQAMSLIVGLVAECLPAVFYLSAFLFFVRFRRGGRTHSLLISIAAFIAGLLTKESAVTLPLMLFSFDILKMISSGTFHSRREKFATRAPWRNLLLPYAPYAFLLFIYLGWRRRVLSSYLRESNWANRAPEVTASPQGFWHHASHFAGHAWQLQVFNFHNLFPYSVPVLVLVLGIFLVWMILLFRTRRNVCRAVLLALSVGMAWFTITNLPYLIEEQVPYHLYLPAAGLCICIACLAVSASDAQSNAENYFRISAMTFLVTLSLFQMWNGESQYVRLGEMSERMTLQLQTSLSKIPQGDLVILWPSDSSLVASGWGEGMVPFAVQPPFTDRDLASRVRILEHFDMSCCGIGGWWPQASPILIDEMAKPSSEPLTLHALTWNQSAASFELNTRVIPRKLLIDSVDAALGGSPQSIESIDDDQAMRLVKALRDLAAGT
jgi:hypothetical protein